MKSCEKASVIKSGARNAKSSSANAIGKASKDNLYIATAPMQSHNIRSTSD